MNEVMIPENKEIEQGISDLSVRALQVKVIDNETYVIAGDLLSLHKKMEKDIKAWFEGDGKSGIKPTAYAHWKAICAKENAEIAKLTLGTQHLDKQMTTYNLKKEAERQAEELRLRKLAEQEEENRRLAAAIEAEKEGNKEEAEAILEEPVFVPPPIIEKTVPKIAGQTMTTVYRARVTDLKALCRAVTEGKAPLTCIQANESFLNNLAKNSKGTEKIAGIEFYPESSMRGVRQ